MKLTNNTFVPKIIAMNTEIEIVDRALDELVSIFTITDELEYVAMLQKMIERMPKLKYFEEEINSIKECLIDIYDGYESRADGLSYVHFMKRVIQNTKDYIKEMK